MITQSQSPGILQLLRQLQISFIIKSMRILPPCTLSENWKARNSWIFSKLQSLDDSWGFFFFSLNITRHHFHTNNKLWMNFVLVTSQYGLISASDHILGSLRQPLWTSCQASGASRREQIPYFHHSHLLLRESFTQT